MRDLIRPLKLTTQNSAVTPGNDGLSSADLSSQSALYSCTSSDGSEPPTPTFSLRSHSRFPSSASSLASSSTSPICENSDVSGSAIKLPMPKLDEDPTEHDDTIVSSFGAIHDMSGIYHFDHGGDCQTGVSSESNLYDLESSFGDDHYALGPRMLKRQKSLDLSGTISSRLGERFPSFSNRWKSRRPGPIHTGPGVLSRATSIQRPSRSSSLTSRNFPGHEQGERLPPSPSVYAGIQGSEPVAPIDIDQSQGSEYVDREILASTPLLPPMMKCFQEEPDEVQSPLQSPTIADDKTFSTISSPTSTPLLPDSPSPVLSPQVSVASFNGSRAGNIPALSDVPAFFLADPTDEWSIKLGHANFSLQPEPYMPITCNAQSCRQLINDWELARTQYFIHKHRTIQHYGKNSKTFKLTEQKWAHIDAQWRNNKDRATARAARTGMHAVSITASEPAPLTMMPTFDDPGSEGKFPILGDQDIVGPMEQIAARTQVPARQGTVVKFLSNIFGVSQRTRSATR